MSHFNTHLPSLIYAPAKKPSAKLDWGDSTRQPMAALNANCSGCVNRRAFLTALAGAAGAAGLIPFATGWALASPQAPTGGGTRIRLVFSHHRDDAKGKQSEAGWPFLGYDCTGRKKELLAKLQQRCPGIEFLPATAYNAEDAKKILEADQEVDGYLAYMIGGWANAGQTIAAAGRPVIYVGDLYGASGEFLVAVAEARHKGLRAVGVTSSRFDDVVVETAVEKCGGWRSNSAAPDGSKRLHLLRVKQSPDGSVRELEGAGGGCEPTARAPGGALPHGGRQWRSLGVSRRLASCSR